MSKYDEILEKHAAAAAEEMKAEAAKTETQRQVETLNDELETVSGRIKELLKSPSAHRAELDAARASQNGILQQLDALGATKKPAYGPTTGAGGRIVIPYTPVATFDPRSIANQTRKP